MIQGRIQAINDKLSVSKGDLPVTSVHMGATVRNAQAMYEGADEALYRAKAKGCRGSAFHGGDIHAT